MPLHRVLVAGLIIALVSGFVPVNDVAAQSRSGGAMAEPLDGKQAWPFDAVIVFYANRALKYYAALPPAEQQKLEQYAYSVAKVRRASLARLIESGPQLALLLSLSPVERQGLPNGVLGLLEKRVHTTGDLRRWVTEELPGGLPEPSPQPPPNNADAVSDHLTDPNLTDNANLPDRRRARSITSWTVHLEQGMGSAYLYGIRLQHQTKFDTPIHGIVLDDRMAVSESPLYRYDPLETEQLGFKPGAIVATYGYLPMLLPDLEAYDLLWHELIRAILEFGPVPTQAPNAWTTGTKRLLVIKINFAGDIDDPATPEDERETPYSDGDIAIGIGGANAFYRENSQLQTGLTPFIISAPYTLPRPASDFTGASSINLAHALIAQDALAIARAYGFDPDEFDRILVLTRELFDRPTASAAIGGKTVTIAGEKAAMWVTLSHELGHTYGFIHSSFWRVLTGVDPISPSGEGLEYGDAWDIMGGPTPATADDWLARHLNVTFKNLAGWLGGTNVADGTAGGVFRLRPHDSLDAAGLRAIYVEAGDGTVYWLGMRRRFPDNASMANGIEVRRAMHAPGFTYGPLLLLDMDGFVGAVSHSLERFDQFDDTANSLNIRIANVFEDDLGPYADIVITR